MAEHNVFIDLSCGQYTDLGRALNNYYYSNPSLRSLAPSGSGYPHNGGEHTLTIRGPQGECLAFLELMREAYPKAAEAFDLMIERVQLGDRDVRIKRLMPHKNAA